MSSAVSSSRENVGVEFSLQDKPEVATLPHSLKGRELKGLIPKAFGNEQKVSDESPLRDSERVALMNKVKPSEIRDSEGKTALFRAAEKGDYDEVERLLDLGHDPNLTDTSGKTILLAATCYFDMLNTIVTGKQYSLIELLLQRGTDPKKLRKWNDKYGFDCEENCFDHAAAHRNRKLLLLFKKFSPQEPYFTEDSLGGIIEQFVDQDFLWFMLDFAPHQLWLTKLASSPLTAKGINSTTALRIREQQPEFFKKYIGKKAFYYPLWILFKRTCGQFAHEKFDAELADFFFENGAPMKGMSDFLCTEEGDPQDTLEAVRWLIRHGVDVNEKDRYGFTALHRWLSMPCVQFRKVIFQELLKAEADITILDKWGKSALDYVKEKVKVRNQDLCYEEILEWMQESPSAAPIKEPPLHQAILDKNESLVGSLAKKEDLLKKDAFDRTAAEIAIDQYNLPFLKILVGKNPQKYLALPLLQRAAGVGDAEIFEYLVKVGFGSPGAFVTALESALQKCHSQIVAYYLQTLPATSPVWKGQKVAEYAAQGGYIDVLVRIFDDSQGSSDILEQAFYAAALAKQSEAALYLLSKITTPPKLLPIVKSNNADLLLAVLEKFPDPAPLLKEDEPVVLSSEGLSYQTSLKVAIQLGNKKLQTIIWNQVYNYLCQTKESSLEFIKNTIEMGDGFLLQKLFSNTKMVEGCKDIWYTFDKCLQKAALRGNTEVVNILIQQNFPVKPRLVQGATNYDSVLASALQSGNRATVDAVFEGYRKQNVTPDFDFLCADAQKGRLGDFKDTTYLYELMFQFYRPTWKKEGMQECIQLVASMGINSSSALVLKYGLITLQSLDTLLPYLQKTKECIEELRKNCHVTLEGTGTLETTLELILEQIFQHIFLGMNPSLAEEPDVFQKIVPLFSQVKKTEDYASLLLALQVCTNMELAAAAFSEACRVDRGGALPPKALLKLKTIDSPTSGDLMKALEASFLSPEDVEAVHQFLSSTEQCDIRTLQKNYLSYLAVYRSRQGLSACHFILKNFRQYPELLPLALMAIETVGVRRYNKALLNKQIVYLEEIIRESSPEVCILALKALSIVTRPSPEPNVIQFLLNEIAQRKGETGLEGAFIDTLASYDYEQIPKGLVDSVLGILAFCTEPVRQKIALFLSGLPDEKALLTALNIVKGHTWDSYAKAFGTNRKNRIGTFLLFRSRPDSIHDNRASIIERIENNLARLHSHDARLEQEVEAQYQEFAKNHSDKELCAIEKGLKQGPEGSIRYLATPLFFPKNTDLIRGLSTRKGEDSFKESIRDLIRKGAGSACLTDHDSDIDGATWKKIGHVFGTHNADLFFSNESGCTYFSSNGKDVISDSALVIFPASFHEHEYLVGQARMEKEGTYNNVFYRGIPKAWIKAIYLPEGFRDDIELLGGDSPISSLKENFTSELFRKQSDKELVEFRRHLLTKEKDLSGTYSKEVPFLKKIRFFPEGGAQEVADKLHHDGIRFSSEDAVQKETLKWVIRRRLIRKMYTEKTGNPVLFSAQDELLHSPHDADFVRFYPQFLDQLPASMKEHFPSSITLEQILLKEDSAAISRIACLYSLTPGSPYEKIERMKTDLKDNPGFFGLSQPDLQTLEKMLEMKRE